MLCFQFSSENADDFAEILRLSEKSRGYRTPPSCGNGGAERIERVLGRGLEKVFAGRLKYFRVSLVSL